jgi:hypothetical protein
LRTVVGAREPGEDGQSVDSHVERFPRHRSDDLVEPGSRWGAAAEGSGHWVGAGTRRSIGVPSALSAIGASPTVRATLERPRP